MRGVILVLAVCLFPLGVSAEPELVLERALWGFTGKPIPGTFNLLTVEVRNVSGEPYEGSIQLAKASVGVPEVQQIGVAPGGRRTVQFTPYIEEHGIGVYSWRLIWDKGRSNLSEFQQSLGDGYPGTVTLIEDTNTFAKGESIFPRFRIVTFRQMSVSWMGWALWCSPMCRAGRRRAPKRSGNGFNVAGRCTFSREKVVRHWFFQGS